MHRLFLSLASGCSVCAFDFSGSGMSDGDDVTWGYQEKKDLAAVLKYLSAHASAKEVASQAEAHRQQQTLQRSDDLKRYVGSILS